MKLGLPLGLALFVALGGGLSAQDQAAATDKAERRQVQVHFSDATAKSGLSYKNVCGEVGSAKVWLTETLGAGAAWLDYDGDGHLDLYVVNGSTHQRGRAEGEPNRLFRGDGKGGFQDVTVKAGVGHRGWGHGVAVADYDNDGDPDIYVTNLGTNVLYRNRGDGTFEDVSKAAGVTDPSWSTSAAFFDMERDGDLDLYVANYVAFDPRTVPRKGKIRAAPPFCSYKGRPVICGPAGLVPAQDVLYRNNGDGTFQDVTQAAGVRLEQPRFALGVVTGDYDNDGDQDIYVANDGVANSLWRNKSGKFSDVGLTALAALNLDGVAQSGMGVDLADYDDDGWLDIVVTNFSFDFNTIYRNHRGRFFVDESNRLGMSATFRALSWAAEFHDFDNDADLDLFIANGHVFPEMEQVDVGTKYLQRNHLFLQDEGRFHEVSQSAGPGLAPRRSFRGAAFGDYDADGDVDAVVTAMADELLLLRNDTPTAGNYLSLRLVGSTSNRDAVGTRVTLTTGGRTQRRERKGGGSYLSASSPWLHFGLGAAEQADSIEIRWPGGRRQQLKQVPANRQLVLTEPK